MLQDLQFAIRLLVKDKWFTLVATLALALGIGVNATVFTFVNAVLIRGLPVDDPDRVMALNSPRHRAGSADGRLVSRLHRLAQRHARALGGWRPITSRWMNVSEEGRAPERFSGTFISANAFRLLGQAADPRARFPPRRRSSRRAAGGPAGRRRVEKPLRRQSVGHRTDGARERRAVGHHRRDAGGLQVPAERGPLATARDDP